MDIEVDHYQVLGLPSGEEGARLTDKEISKAYKLKALELHPDKRPDDPNAHDNFQTLKNSYEILRDEKARKLFDDLLRIKHEKKSRNSQYEAKRQKMVSELEKREQSAFTADPVAKEKREEERIKKKLQEEITRIRKKYTDKTPFTFAGRTDDRTGSGAESEANYGKSVLDNEKVLKVSWEKVGGDYSAGRLREIFEQFGKVEDVVIINAKKKKGKALIVMSSKEAVFAASGSVSGDLSNPLLVLPLQTSQTVYSPSIHKPVDVDGPSVSNLVGAGYQEFEDSVLKKLREASEKQKRG